MSARNEIDAPAPGGAEVRDSGRWLDRELATLAATRPRAVAAVRRVASRPQRVLIPLALVILGSLGAASPEGDALWFRRAGVSMLGPRVLDVFAEPGLQIGPLYLLALGAATAATSWLPTPVMLFVLAGGQAAAVTWLALVTARHAARHAGVSPLPAQWATGLALVLGGLLGESIGSGHPEEIALGLLLALAALGAAHGRGRAVGGLLGVAIAVKLWGVLGAPVALIGRRPRTVVVAGAVTVLLVVVTYAPFYLGGELNTFEFTWGAGVASPIARAVSGGAADWTVRLVQGVVSVVVGGCLALRRTGSPLTVVVGVVGARLLLDPLFLSYYPGPLVVVALVWLWTRQTPGLTRWRLPLTLLVPVGVLMPYLAPWASGPVAGHAVVLLVMLGTTVVDAREGRGAARVSLHAAEEAHHAARAL